MFECQVMRKRASERERACVCVFDIVRKGACGRVRPRSGTKRLSDSVRLRKREACR